MVRICALSGSLRAGSFNTALLRAIESVSDDGIDVDVQTLHGIPLYDGDLEKREGIPPAVTALREKIEGCDALLIASPEYNNSMPGVLKNAIDWLSRRPDDKPHVFKDRIVAIVGATPGGFGTTLAQNAWLPVMRTLQTRQWFGGRLMVSRAGKLVGDDGGIEDEETLARLREFVRDFANFVRAQD